MSRTSPQDLTRQAETDLTAVLEDLGLKVRPGGSQAGANLLVDLDGKAVLIDVKAATLVTPERAAQISKLPTGDPTAVRIVVGDSIASAAKAILKARGWGWFDRRHGHLVLRGQGLLVDTTVPAFGRPRRAGSGPLVGRAAKSYAAALLMTPDTPPSIRQIAHDSGMAPATVGEAALRLREAALVRADGRPLYPELFWELADVWEEYEPVPIRIVPPESDLISLLHLTGADDESHPVGPALAGTAAAIAYGAPAIVAGDVPPDLYLPSPAAVSFTERRFGRAQRFEERACSISVAPVLLVCSRRSSIPTKSPWKLAHPLFVALDLAQDKTRGREILADFNPPEDFTRVW